MVELKEKQKSARARWWRLCPVRHALSLFGLLLIAAYFALRRSATVMAWLSAHLVRPWHRLVSRLLAPLPFSMAEALIVLGVLAGSVYIIIFLVQIIRKPSRWKRLYRFLLLCLTVFSLVYGGFCLLWGVYYYTADFEDQSGIRGGAVSAEQLAAVTRHFTRLVNSYGEAVARDGDGVFCEDLESIFAASPALYDAVAAEIPCLSGDRLAAKPFHFSKILSYLNFTGFFSPFTGEANINVDSPAALIPATIAHEISHQRGVAQEDEANFAGILACLENGDPVYCYSACLLAYIHLGNALYRADYAAWEENYRHLSDGVLADLEANRSYWARFETPAATVSDTVYTGFLESYGQTLGLQTYGKCVDLLAAYYYDAAREGVS
jgi:hypothetical protein